MSIVAGLLTDSMSGLTRREAFAHTRENGIDAVELGTGNWSPAPHLDLPRILRSPEERNRLRNDLQDYGLTLEALNMSGNPLHPVEGEQQQRVIHQSLVLAEELEVHTIVCMSGLPGAPGDSAPNWVTTSWPPENLTLLRHQWNEVALPWWEQFAAQSAEHGIRRIAVEMHGHQLVYSPATLLTLRREIGDIIGANLDPSHLMWMGADILDAADVLAGAIHHVHAKDTAIYDDRRGGRTLLETLPFDAVEQRSWNFVSLGEGHPGGEEFWAEFFSRLQAGGFSGVASIEHEDASYTQRDGVSRSAKVLHQALGAVSNSTPNGEI